MVFCVGSWGCSVCCVSYGKIQFVLVSFHGFLRALFCSMSCDQAGTMHPCHHVADVQDTSSQCPHLGIFSECPLPGWDQIQWLVRGEGEKQIDKQRQRKTERERQRQRVKERERRPGIIWGEHISFQPNWWFIVTFMVESHHCDSCGQTVVSHSSYLLGKPPYRGSFWQAVFFSSPEPRWVSDYHER